MWGTWSQAPQEQEGTPLAFQQVRSHLILASAPSWVFEAPHHLK